MKKFLVCILAVLVAVLSLSAVASAAEGLFAADKQSILYFVDPATGAVIPVGPMGVSNVSSMSVDPISGTLYAGIGGGPNTGCLYTVNPATGEATQVGCDSVPSGSNIAGMDFRSDGTLFGYYEVDDGLATINPATGDATYLGDTGLECCGNGIAFNPGDVLYHANDAGLSTLDQTTGAGTFIEAFTYIGFPTLDFPRFNSLSFNESGVLYGTLNDGYGGSGPTYLATIDPATRDVTNIGETLPDLDGLAFVPLVPPTYDATGTWDYSLTNSWFSGPCPPFLEDETGTATITQTGNIITLVVDGDTSIGTISGATYTFFSFETDGETFTLYITFTLSSSTSGSGTITWSWTDGVESCEGGADLAFTKQVADGDGGGCSMSKPEGQINIGHHVILVGIFALGLLVWREMRRRLSPYGR